MLRLAMLCTVMAGACAPQVVYTPIAGQVTPAKPFGCEFEVLTTTPSRPFEEIGVIESDQPGLAWTISEFKEAAAQKVCAHGGDAVIVEANSNGNGAYDKGTILRYLEAREAPDADD
jgi:hypothetical protein